MELLTVSTVEGKNTFLLHDFNLPLQHSIVTLKF